MKQDSEAEVERFNDNMEKIRAREIYRLKVAEIAKQDVIKNAGKELSYFKLNAANRDLKEKMKDPVYVSEYGIAVQEHKTMQRENRGQRSGSRGSNSRSPKQI